MEHSNAAEWDLHRKHERPSPPGDDAGWQTVTKPDKGKGKQQDRGTLSKGASKNGSATATHSRSAQAKRSLGRWQDSGGRPPQPQQHPRAPKLIDDGDGVGNEAQAQWRALEKAIVFVRVPTELAIADEGVTLRRISKEHVTFVATEQRGAAGPDSQTYGIWGSGKDAEATRKAIVAWIEDNMGGPTKSARAAKFAKLHSMTPVLRQRAENRWKREVQRQRFRQYPPLDMAFGAIGTFHWPVKEYAPLEILGANYEALDVIRMDCACYVVWKKNAFQVMGKNMDKVKAALLRLKQTVFQIAAKQLPTTRTYLLHWSEDLRSDRVRLQDYEQPRLLSGPAPAEVKQHPVVLGEGMRVREPEGYASQQSVTSERKIHASILRTLSKLPYYRGNIKLRMHFGRFLATQYILPENGVYELEDYESMVKESQFQGMVTAELGDPEMEQSALTALQGAKDLLMPLDAVTDKLSDVKPTYTAVFTFADKLGDLRLSRSWQQAQDGAPVFDITSQKWTRLDRETNTITSLVDASLTDLKTSFGWAFTLQAAQPVDEQRIEPAFKTFAENLKIDVEAAKCQATDKPFIKFNAYIANTALKSVEQRITYSYGMQDIDYNVELTRFQKTLYPERKSSSAASQVRIFEPRWAVGVHRVDWDVMFAENEQLRIGEKTKWEVNSERWFPKSWHGPDETDPSRYFSEMVAKLGKLGSLLRSGAKGEDLLGGMTVG